MWWAIWKDVSVFSKVSMYITFGQTLKSSHELSSLLYLCSKCNVILSASEENTLKLYRNFFGVEYIFPITETSTCRGKCLFLCAVYVKKFYFKKKWSLMSIIKLLLDEATLSRMRKTIWEEVHIYHCYIKIYILIIFAGFASKLTYLFILDQRHWKVELVSIVSVKNAIRDVLFTVTMNVPQETSVT